MTDAEIIAELMPHFCLRPYSGEPKEVLYGETIVAHLSEPLGQELAQRIRIYESLRALQKAEEDFDAARERLATARNNMNQKEEART